MRLALLFIEIEILIRPLHALLVRVIAAFQQAVPDADGKGEGNVLGRACLFDVRPDVVGKRLDALLGGWVRDEHELVSAIPAEEDRVAAFLRDALQRSRDGDERLVAFGSTPNAGTAFLPFNLRAKRLRQNSVYTGMVWASRRLQPQK